MSPEYNPDYGNPYYDDENWDDAPPPPEEPDELEDYYPETDE